MCIVSFVAIARFGQTVGKDYWGCRAVRTAYLRNPPKPRYNKFWDIRLVFALFKRWGPNENLTLEQIEKEFVLLFLLVSGQRGQAVGAFKLDQLVWSDKGEAVFTLTKLMKTARTGESLMSITLEPYPKDKDLCVVELLFNRGVGVARPPGLKVHPLLNASPSLGSIHLINSAPQVEFSASPLPRPSPPSRPLFNASPSLGSIHLINSALR